MMYFDFVFSSVNLMGKNILSYIADRLTTAAAVCLFLSFGDSFLSVGPFFNRM